MEVSSLFAGVAMVILLAVTSMRFGADSRDGYRSKERELASRGIVWDVPSTTRKPLAPAKAREDRLVQPSNECALAPCSA